VPGLKNLGFQDRLNRTLGTEFTDFESKVFERGLRKLKAVGSVFLSHEQTIGMMVNPQPFPDLFPSRVVSPQAALILMQIPDSGLFFPNALLLKESFDFPHQLSLVFLGLGIQSFPGVSNFA
jgi:hypothetical protein